MEVKTANLTILFASISDFAERTARQTLEESQRLGQSHTALMVPLFRGFAGRVVKSMGDSYLVTFESPTLAVLSGVSIQDRLWEYNKNVPERERIRLRIAINVGEVRQESGDVFGEPVNIAARVLGVAEPGEVYFTEAIHLAMNKAEVPAEEAGAFELKGIPGKVRVFRVTHAPYRLESPIAPPDGSEGAPFGRLGLSRLPTGGVRAILSVGRDLADTLSGRVSVLLRQRGPAVATLLVLVLVVALVLTVRTFSKSVVERALHAVERALPEERGLLSERARELIAQEKDIGEREYLIGRLHEAMGFPFKSIESYQAAARAGKGDAEDRVVELLGHPECRVRVAAASAASALRLSRARGKLTDLAENGGPNEGSGIPFFGCNSKRAARDALQRLDW